MNRKKNAKLRFFTSRGKYVNGAIIHSFGWNNNNNNNRPPACTSTSLWDGKQGINERWPNNEIHCIYIKRLVMAKTVLVEYLEDTYEVSFLSEESISD